MQRLEVKNIDVCYGKKQVVFNVNFDLNDGEIGCLLGPSGCGKTTVLRSIAGFEPVVKGDIVIQNKVVSSGKFTLPPEERKIGMVFQDFALFPHLNVNDNICFGIKHWTLEQRQQRVTELLAMMNMSDYGQAYSHQLSGGQQQRVALARAMAPKPSILLMDEPFSSMDVELREQLAKEVRNILKQENITAVLVTHDQHEAFAMADKICVLHEGKVQQKDNAYNLYHKPINRFVADFIGEGVFVPGSVIDKDTVSTELGDIKGLVPKGCLEGCLVDVLIRPDDIVHDDDASQTATVMAKAFRGAEFMYRLKMPSGIEVLSLVPSHHNHQINEQIGVVLEFDHLVVFSQDEKDWVE